MPHRIPRRVGYAGKHRRLENAIDGQFASLIAEGCSPIFADFHTGQSELEKLLDSIEAGDIIIVTSIDQFAESLLELLTILKRINAKGCQFQSLAEPWANSISATGALTLTVLEALAGLDRNLKRIATANGRFEAKARGTHVGRPAKLTIGQQQEAIARREAGESLTAIARSYHVSRTTIKRLKLRK